ncbi:8055_t:CDS:2 [Entrophospora sp. SA101]|nr:8055_t:CDS:2 [Entrophospora sp. SA101]CAJ0836182.1 15222_t:CDS:2 [Entrophospora sp. SA101]CAJ0895310.1 2620_t:CDS:2 [Entrophospora sp. SA101]
MKKKSHCNSHNQESVSDDNEDELLDANEDLDVFEEGTDNSINRTEDWVELIQNWMNMIDDNEDIYDPLEFIFVDHTIHPVDDPIA